MAKKIIAAVTGLSLFLSSASGIMAVSAGANSGQVTLFGEGSNLAEGVSWSGSTQFKSDKVTPQLAYKNAEKNAVLTFTADVTGINSITVNGATAKAESYTVTIGGETVGSAAHDSRGTDWKDHDVVINITTAAVGEQVVTITDETEEVYINSVSLSETAAVVPTAMPLPTSEPLFSTDIYKSSWDTDYRCGVVYGRGLQMQSDEDSEYYGRLYTTSEYYEKGRWDANEHFKFYESTDNGREWEHVGDLQDTENNKVKFYPDENGEYTVEGEENGEGASTYYDTKWSMRHQPHIYELPEDLGELKKGTIVCAGLTASLETTATEDTDFDGNLHTRIDLYYSTDGCRTWTFLNHLTDGGESRIVNGTAIWEPFLIMENGKLYCFYSDERGFDVIKDEEGNKIGGGGQKLCAAATEDGIAWGDTFDVLNLKEEMPEARPGMPVVAKLNNGKFMITYECPEMGYSKMYSGYKVTDDIESWNPTDKGEIIGASGGGSPYCTVMPDGTIVAGDYSNDGVFVNTNNLETNTWVQIPTGVYHAYSRAYFPLLNGELFIVAGGAAYPSNRLNNLYCGAIKFGNTEITNVKTGEKLAISADSTENGGTLTTAESGSSENWLLADAWDGAKRLVNVNSSKAVGILNGSKAEGASAIQWDASTAADQQWYIIPDTTSKGTGAYKILNKNSLLALSTPSEGNELIQSEYAGDDSQLWEIDSMGVPDPTEKPTEKATAEPTEKATAEPTPKATQKTDTPAAKPIKCYLTEANRESIEGGFVADQTDSSNNSPQIAIKGATTVIVKADNLADYTSAALTYAQNGGTLDIKLTALDAADSADGTVIAETSIQPDTNYSTRTTSAIALTATAQSSAKYLKIELTPTGSADGKSYIDFVELSALSIVSLKSLSNGYVIDVTDAGLENGNIIKASENTSAKSQQWEPKEGNEAGWYYIVNENSGKGIGMSGGTTASGALPVQWTCDGSTNQFWRFVRVEKDGKIYYKILNKGSKKVLTVNDSKITQEEWTGADNQLWSPKDIFGTFRAGSEFDDNYAISQISCEADNYNILYTATGSIGNGMVVEVTLSDGQKAEGKKGSFTVSKDGEYTLTATLYADSSKTVKIGDEVSKTITLTNGKYDVLAAKWTISTELEPWADNGLVEMRNVTDDEIAAIKENGETYISVDQNTRYQTMDAQPWGGCFNEMGWSAMKALTDEQKDEIIRSLYGQGEDSLNFTAGRMSIASSDFGDDMYSYDETTDDYDMSEFDMSRDYKAMIPYIKAAMKYVPDIQIFGSPWTPPSWMKNNNKLNGSDGSNNTIEDTPENFEAYAKYFVKYLEGYADAGIDIHAITPQNEPTMDTPYPSCVWTGEQLNVFIRDYLNAAVDEYNEKNGKNVEMWLGTFTDSQKSLAMPAIKDPVTRPMLDAIAFQWWGAPLASQVHMTDTSLKLVQSETKCGSGQNHHTWGYAEEQFDCFKEFLDAGISQYFLWNMILNSDGKNNALPTNRRWVQNAPITVDGTEITYRPSYYTTKHFSANVDGGARRIKVEGNRLGEGSVSNHVSDLRAIGFQNTDGEVVLNVKNSTATDQNVTVLVNNTAFDVTVPAHSISTFTADGVYENTPDATEQKEVIETTDMKFTNLSTNNLLSTDSYNNGADIKTTSNQGESNQTWSLVPTKNDGEYLLKNFMSDLVLCVWGGKVEEGAKISQYDNTGADDQIWKIEFVEFKGNKPYYKITNKNSSLALTALSETDNNIVTQMAYVGDDNQLWELNLVGGDWEYPNDPKTPSTDSNVTVNGDKCVVTSVLKNIPEGSSVITTAYNSSGECIGMKMNVAAAENVSAEFDTNADISYFKVMVWDSFAKMKSITLAETVEKQ